MLRVARYGPSPRHSGYCRAGGLRTDDSKTMHCAFNARHVARNTEHLVMSVITILSDFGVDDEYVGVMKGVIHSICPKVSIVDITHRIDPQDIEQAAYLLPSYFRFFPAGTVHIAVVDPGVGSRRNIVAVHLRQQVFIAPDNGVLTLLLNTEKSDTIVNVHNSAFFLDPPSPTFHGRDIFAAVAAHIACGPSWKPLAPNCG